MKLTFSPVLGPAPMTLTRSGDVLTVDGTEVDLSSATRKAPLVVDHPAFVGPVTRYRGALRVALRLPHGPNAPKATRFPKALKPKGDGPVTLPLFETPERDESETP